MSIHKLTAGSGYHYLTRQVAALDATEKGHTGLASYYTERGETPGEWIGSGMDGIDGLEAGDPVTAEQMRALFGCGLHPLAELRQQQLAGPDLSPGDFQDAARLGAPFKIVDGVVSPFRLEMAKRIGAINTAAGLPAGAALPASDRARMRTEVARQFFLAEHGREPIDARELAGQIAKDSRPRTQVPWWTCSSMSCSIVDLLPSPHLTTSRNRSRCGASTGRRSTPSPAPPSTPRSGSSTPRPVSSRRDSAAVRLSSRRRSTWRCWRWRRTALHWMLGRRHWSVRCALRGTSAARDRPRRHRETTAMRALTMAWTQDGGSVAGLAPSAAAAAVLAEQTGIRSDTLAKLTWSLQHGDLPDWAAAVGPSTLVIIDEAGMADTLSLDTAVQFVIARGGSVRLVGDDQQLAAIGAGGVLRDIQHTHGALRLTELHRFTDPAEAAASLALREGKPEALGFYLDHGRIHVGDGATTTEDAFNAWVSDRAAGLDTIMIAPTRNLVAQLNARARAHRLNHTPAASEVSLADGNRASVGDVIITRSNDRRLRLTATDWVKNGDRWTITAIGRQRRPQSPT